MRLAEMNRQEVRAIEEGNQAAVDTLKAEEMQLSRLVQEKGREIGRLLEELEGVRRQHSGEKADWERMLKALQEEKEADKQQSMV